MDEHFAALPITNATMLCVGGVTRSEADRARDEGLDVDGTGYYLFLAKEGERKHPIKILAKFFSEIEAQTFARTIAARFA
jgi:hypothetical protein